MNRILFIEDDAVFGMILSKFLTKNGFDVHHIISLGSFDEIRSKITDYQLLLLDYRLPDGTAEDFLKANDSISNSLPIIVITSFNDVRTAVQLMKLGVRDYVTKPINQDELLLQINYQLKVQSTASIVKQEHKVLDSQRAKKSSSNSFSDQFVRGISKAAQRLYQNVDIIAPTNMSVLISGESGTGKEHIARLIHEFSDRKGKPYVAIDCGALSKELAASELFGHVKGSFTGAVQDKKGCFELADGGTLFLDEIGNLSYEVQIKLLRVLQEKMIQPIGSSKSTKVDVRLITATNENLSSTVAEGDFREDIYHRINEFQIKMPALRERKEDLPFFVNSFIEKSNEELTKSVEGIDKDAMKFLEEYHWPGNLRELKNMIRRLVLMCNSTSISVGDLPSELTSLSSVDSISSNEEIDLKAIQRDNEKQKIIEALEMTHYNKSKAAKLLNIDRKTLYLKIEKYKLNL